MFNTRPVSMQKLLLQVTCSNCLSLVQVPSTVMWTIKESTVNCPNLVSSYHTPKIYWYQTDNSVVLRIPLIDVEKYKIKVEYNTLQFSTVLKEVKYFIGMTLCGYVIPEKTSHQKLGREIKVCLIKVLKWIEWPRLQVQKEKNPFIILDPDHIVKKSWDDPFANISERESFAEYKKRMNITNIMPPESSTSGSESDDERIIGYDVI